MIMSMSGWLRVHRWYLPLRSHNPLGRSDRQPYKIGPIVDVSLLLVVPEIVRGGGLGDSSLGAARPARRLSKCQQTTSSHRHCVGEHRSRQRRWASQYAWGPNGL